MTIPSLMPVVFVPHGGGPMPLLGEPNHAELVAFLKTLGEELPSPKAIVVVTAHWETNIATVSAHPTPSMIYDYSGFPPESYHITYPAPGSPSLAEDIAERIQMHSAAELDSQRGFDHGTFVPLLLMYPEAKIPVVQVSLLRSLDPAAHIALGKQLAPLREQGVLIVGSGMSFHNMRGFFDYSATTLTKSLAFDGWLTDTLTQDMDSQQREQRLAAWQQAPDARFCHPREEHLLPLHVCLGAASPANADGRAVKNFSARFFASQISGFIWPGR